MSGHRIRLEIFNSKFPALRPQRATPAERLVCPTSKGQSLVLVDQRLPRANAAKNMLLGASTVLAGAIYILGGPVDWFAVVPLAIGLFAGSLGGPIIARYAPAHLLRLAVAALGFVLALNSGCTPPDLTLRLRW